MLPTGKSSAPHIPDKHTDVDKHTDIRHGPAQENKYETSFGELRELC